MARNTPAPVQQYRGPSTLVEAYTGPAGELVVDTTKNTVVVQDGTTAGGHPLAKESVKIVAESNMVLVNGTTEASLASDEISINIVPANLAPLLVADNDNILSVDANGQIAADVSATYDMFTGTFQLLGHENAVLSELTIPAATSAVKAVNLVDGKPDASGEVVEGEYHVSLQFSDGEGQWGEVIGVIFTATQGSASAAVAISAAMATAGTSTVRAWFNGQEGTATVSGTGATITFADASALTFTDISATGTAVGANVTFIPGVGLIAGKYLCITWSLYDGTVSDTFVDMDGLVDVYTAGTGLTLTGTEFAVDTSWLDSYISGNVGCALISSTEGNQLQCDNDKLLVVSDYGTME